MSETTELTAEPRDGAGKGPARALRRQGRVPGIVYGGKDAPFKISLVEREVKRELENNPHFFNAICELKMNGKTVRVVPREAQTHPVKDLPLHLDFVRVTRGQVVTVNVPVHFLNEDDSRGLRRGGVLNIVRRELELACPVESIPSFIEVDIGGLDINDSVHISEVPLPEGVQPTITDRDFTVCTVAPPSGGAGEEEEEEEAAAEEGEEGAEEEAAEGETESGETKESDEE